MSSNVWLLDELIRNRIMPDLELEPVTPFSTPSSQLRTDDTFCLSIGTRFFLRGYGARFSRIHLMGIGTSGVSRFLLTGLDSTRHGNKKCFLIPEADPGILDESAIEAMHSGSVPENPDAFCLELDGPTTSESGRYEYLFAFATDEEKEFCLQDLTIRRDVLKQSDSVQSRAGFGAAPKIYKPGLMELLSENRAQVGYLKIEIL